MSPKMSPPSSHKQSCNNMMEKRRRDEEETNINNNNNNENETSVITLGDPDLLDCPICCQLLQSPVYQCFDGHYVCESCCNKMHNKCPSCSLPIGFIRCRAIEKIVESALTSCVYMQYGCFEKVSYPTKLDHERTCKFSTIACPRPGCAYVGVPKCIYAHFANKHWSFRKSFNFNLVKSVEVVIDEAHILLQEVNEKTLFVIHRVVDPLGSFVNVTCIAPAASDTKFSYELTAKRGENSINLKSSVELTPECYEVPAKEKCHLIRNDLHEFREDRKVLTLQLVIRKQTAK